MMWWEISNYVLKRGKVPYLYQFCNSVEQRYSLNLPYSLQDMQLSSIHSLDITLSDHFKTPATSVVLQASEVTFGWDKLVTNIIDGVIKSRYPQYLQVEAKLDLFACQLNTRLVSFRSCQHHSKIQIEFVLISCSDLHLLPCGLSSWIYFADLNKAHQWGFRTIAG